MIGQNGSHFKTTTHLDGFLTLCKSRYLVLCLGLGEAASVAFERQGVELKFEV